MQRIEIITHIDIAKAPTEIGYFMLDPHSKDPGEARFSADERALFIPTLSLRDAVARRIANGGTLFGALRGVHLRMLQPQYNATRELVMHHPLPWSYVWGDFQLFESGESTVKHAILLAGVIRDVDLTVVGRYVKEMTARPKVSDQSPIST
jgi:hypothetical protein